MIYTNGKLIEDITVKKGSSTNFIQNVTCYKTSTGRKHYVYYDKVVSLYVDSGRLTIDTGPYLGKVGIMYGYQYKKFLGYGFNGNTYLINQGQSGFSLNFPDDNLVGAFAECVFFHPYCSDEIIQKYIDSMNQVYGFDSSKGQKLNELWLSYDYSLLQSPDYYLPIKEITDQGYVTPADCNEQVFGFICLNTAEIPKGDIAAFTYKDFIDNWYNAQ